MKNISLKLAVISVFSYATTVFAVPGLVNIPVAGFGASAYTSCNTTGNFGSGSGAGAPVPPGSGTNDTCAYFPNPANDNASPESGYTLVTSATRTLTMNNIYTGGTSINVGSVIERVWRKPAATAPVTTTPMCIYGAKVSLTNTDYNTTEAGSQRFEVNDLARGGFDGLSVDAGYGITAANASPVYRIGRTYTSVQHRAAVAAPANPCGDLGGSTSDPSYLALPGFGSTASINGVNRYTGLTAKSCPMANPAVTEQAADVNGSWVDFTFDANAADDDGSTQPFSAMTYVKAACTTAAPITRADAIRVRATAQEKTPFISLTTSGFVPDTAPATITPAPAVPF